MTDKATAISPASVDAPRWRKHMVYGLFTAFAVWCLLAFRRDIAQIDLSPLQSGWHAVLAAAALSLWNYALRVIRWRMYLVRLGAMLPWRFVALTFMSGFAFTLSPGKLGEMVRGRYYQPKGIPMSAVTGAFFVERLLDLLVMILLAVAVLADLQAYRSFLWVAVALVGGLLASIALMPWGSVAQKLGRKPHGKLLSALSSLANMFVNARQFLSPGVLLAGLALGLFSWGAEALGLQLVGDVIAPGHLSVPAAMGIYSIAIIVGALSFLPGGLGSTETVMTALLVAHGFAVPQAILLTLVCRLLTLWLAVIIGWLCVWLLRHEMRHEK
ncbi:MAG: lysylphosphatidylglycerol synthase transmembrane domain-containing protein [Aquabacterium sp.]